MHLQHITRLEITPDKQYIAAAGNPHVRLFEVNTNNANPVTSFDGHKSNVTAVGFQKDGKWMFTGSEDGTVKVCSSGGREDEGKNPFNFFESHKSNDCMVSQKMANGCHPEPIFRTRRQYKM